MNCHVSVSLLNSFELELRNSRTCASKRFTDFEWTIVPEDFSDLSLFLFIHLKSLTHA